MKINKKILAEIFRCTGLLFFVLYIIIVQVLDYNFKHNSILMVFGFLFLIGFYFIKNEPEKKNNFFN
jgi:hypothetical protein